MSFTILSWGTEELIPKYWGYIDQAMIDPNDDSIMIRSLAMRCEKCSDKNNWRVLEGGEKSHLFFIIPLGSTKYLYKVYCNKCDAFQMTISKSDMYELIEKGIAIKGSGK